ncbi:hypothetical protein V5P93_006161 [Actinokineospora auranticolor]|uniref:WD domain G-beta repeat uncharacterized protein n=1 Tax=Actinokineospora auranticolor TaxID=155976 RepID=A0A2S6GGB5_9PSEU|nr:hypothetical protein [Actinokineospora auranticolor]PPK64252.1 WD domain G-beta repeat uncharacterized protein [Actinokineospora auranticolor]
MASDSFGTQLLAALARVDTGPARPRRSKKLLLPTATGLAVLLVAGVLWLAKDRPDTPPGAVQVSVAAAYPVAGAATFPTDSGRALAMVDVDGVLRVRRATGQVITGKLIAGRTVAFSPNGRLVAVGFVGLARASGGGEGVPEAGAVWDISDPARPARRATLDGGALVNALAFSHDGRFLAEANTQGRVRLLDVTTPARIRPLSASYVPVGVNTVVFAPGDRRLAVGTEDGTIAMWDLTDPSEPVEKSVLGPQGGEVKALAFTPDGRAIASGDASGELHLWTTDGPQPQNGFLHWDGIAVTALNFSSNGRTLAVGKTDGSVQLWDIAKQRLQSGFRLEAGVLTSVNPDFGSDAFVFGTSSGVAEVRSP